MNKVLLDTNFIMNSVQCKIDFFEDLENAGFEIFIPEAVIGELRKVMNSKKKLKFRQDAELGLKLLNNNKFTKIEMGARYADTAIVRYLKDKPDVILATMDKALKKRVKNPIMVVRSRKKLEIV